MSMAHLLFVRDFEAEIDAERLLADRPAPTHTDADLAVATEAARADGYAAGLTEGWQAGHAAAREGIEAQRLEAIETLALAVGELMSGHADHRARLEAEMAAFTADLAERVFPEIVERLGPARLQAELARIARRAIGSPTLDIRLAPAVADGLGADLIAAGTAVGQTVRVMADPALTGSEVAAQWRDGRSRYSFPAICRAILTLIRQAALPPSTDQGPTP